MNLMILDDNFDSVYLIENYQSLIWTERYQEAGDFELYTLYDDFMKTISEYVLNRLNSLLDTYLWLDGAESLMIIDTIELEEDSEDGPNIKITGKSLEIILKRRIFWKKSVFDSKFDYAIKRMLNENIIQPSDSSRKIDNFKYIETDDQKIKDVHVSAQITGGNLYAFICELCRENNFGFKVFLSDQNVMCFQLYSGKDRSYDQIDNAYIEFSQSFGNLNSSNYIKSTTQLCNVALVAGEDLGTGEERKTISIGTETGLKRRELFVDARDIQSENGEETIPEDQYLKHLETRGKEYLSKTSITELLEADINPNAENYIYGVNYFKGDIVQIATEYGFFLKAMVTEVVRAYDKTGYNLYPTFTFINE